MANNGNNTVSEFAPGSTTAIATYSDGLANPTALIFDSNGNLYVASYDDSTVLEFAAGSTTAIATYSAGLSLPRDLAFDSHGNLYVVNQGNDTVTIFAPGSTAVSATYSTDDGSSTVNQGNDNGGEKEFALAGSIDDAALRRAGGDAAPFALAFDSRGDLFVLNQDGDSVSEFAPGKTLLAAGGVVIQSSVESRPMQIGGSNNAAVNGIDLTSAELAQIFTTSTGTVTIGDSSQTGSITFSTATPATTPGAALT